MDFVGVEERNGNFVLRNSDFEIVLDQRGFVEKWSVRDFKNILSKPSFVLDIGESLGEPYVNPLSNVVSFEFDTSFGEINRVFTVKEKAIVIDDILISKNSCNVSYKISLFFEGFDYFMVGKDKFDKGDKLEIKAKDLLLVNEESDMYIGFIFKEEMDLAFRKEREALQFDLSNRVELGVSDMFMFSFTFSLV